MSKYVDPKIYKKKPSPEGRTEKEMAVYELLDKLRIPYERVDHDPVDSIEDCLAVEEVLGVKICKNLFLRNQQKTTFYLLLLPGDKQFRTKDFSRQLGIARVSFGEPDFMEEYLNIEPGAVSILGLMNDTDYHVELVIDKELLDETYIGCHPCVNTSTLKIKLNDLKKKFIKHTGHFVSIAEL